ncbi:MAG: hypothetical protein HZA50_11560 [Planctomycetes bacterium]|nr:hypothetical protein [Planctomycetota bacterium]
MSFGDGQSGFFASFHCRSRAHCKTCRDRERGREWRKMMWGSFGDPTARYEVDFECPPPPAGLGLPWGAPSQPRPLPTLSLADQRIAVNCRKCENYQNRRCILYLGGHCSGCQFNAYMNQPLAICPDTGKGF